MYLINGTIFEKKIYWKSNVCFDFLYNVRQKTFFILRIERDMIVNVYRSSSKLPLILYDFNETLNFETEFRIIV